MGEEVLRTMRGISGELSHCGGDLFVGDSTLADFVYRMSELHRKELLGNLGDGCGVIFHLMHGSAKPPFFLNHSENAAWRGCSCDWCPYCEGGIRAE